MKDFKPKIPTLVGNAYTVTKEDEFLLIDTGDVQTITITLMVDPPNGAVLYMFGYAGNGGIQVQTADSAHILVGETSSTLVGANAVGPSMLVYAKPLDSWLWMGGL